MSRGEGEGLGGKVLSSKCAEDRSVREVAKRQLEISTGESGLNLALHQAPPTIAIS